MAKNAKSKVTRQPSKEKGRPAGRPNREYTLVDHEPSRCPKCESTEREPYFGQPIEVAHRGLTAAGEPYTHVVKRRTCCTACGQHRIDRCYENRVPPAERLPDDSGATEQLDPPEAPDQSADLEPGPDSESKPEASARDQDDSPRRHEERGNDD